MAADMKETIAAATLRLITEKNIKKLTVKDIAEECNITRQTFYYHFEDIPALFRWVLERDGEWMVQEALSQENSEKGLFYLFQVAVAFAPYIKKGLKTNYAAELQGMLLEYCQKFFEQIAEREHLLENYSASDRRLFLRYHSYAVIGLMQGWTDEDTKNMEDIVHKLHLLLMGEVKLR